MGSSTEYFYDDVIIAKRIEQGIKTFRISEPTKKKRFTRKKKNAEVGNVEGGYKGKMTSQNQNYQSHQTSSF
jgi:hypothetical protein